MTFRLIKSYLNSSVSLVKQAKQMSDTSVSVMKEKCKYDGRIKKRNWQERRSDNENNDNVDNNKKSKTEVRIKRRKYAMLLGYSGADYYGMQRNPQMKTIEEDLLRALLKVDLITEEAFQQIQTIQFQRAARTDKGVSAARQVVSLKLPEVVDISSINKELSDQIKVFSVKRVTKGFNSKSTCDARTYIYMLPTLSFANYQTPVDFENYRIDAETLNRINETLKLFTGTKNFHNFTSKKLFKDPSAMRFIMKFEIEQPFIRRNVEFAIIKIKGQSFMLHQIRKMIGLTIAIIRGLTTSETINRSYSSEKLDLPMAPGLGLILDQVHYDRYNKRYSNDHEQLEWDENEKEIDEFKEKFIYPTIIDTEINEKSMILWLETLPKHSFDVRKEEESDLKTNDDSDSKEKQNNVTNE